MANEMQCPCCEFVARDRKHPKDSSTVASHIELLNHLQLYHKREIEERLARGNHTGVRE